jgi:NAD-reducing hydrogenase small subunit
MMMSAKLKFATVWLDGCSGCHMSFLDIDERLIALAEKVEVVYSPLVDPKVFPDSVDITLVEGAVSSQDDLEKIKKVRAHTKTLIALGDCAVTANVPSMRNPFGVEPVLRRAYYENVNLQPQTPTEHVPPLLKRARPVHDFVPVDVHIPGCAPAADTIFAVLSALVEGRQLDINALTRFGA